MSALRGYGQRWCPHWTDANGNGVWDSGEGDVGTTRTRAGSTRFTHSAGTYTVRYDQATAPSGYVPARPLATPPALSATLRSISCRLRSPSALGDAVDSTIATSVWIASDEDGAFDTGESSFPTSRPALRDINKQTMPLRFQADVLIRHRRYERDGQLPHQPVSSRRLPGPGRPDRPGLPVGAGPRSRSPPSRIRRRWTLAALENKPTIDFAYNYTSSMAIWFGTTTTLTGSNESGSARTACPVLT